MNKTIRFFLSGIILIAASALPLTAQPAARGQAIPVIMVDGTPCLNEEVDGLVLIWNEQTAGFVQNFQDELRTHIAHCERLLSGFSTIPSFESGDLRALRKQIAESATIYYRLVSSLRQEFREYIATAGLAAHTPVVVLDTVKFDALFPAPPLVSIDGGLFPAAAVSALQEAMSQAGAAQGELLYAELEKTLTAICEARKANSMDMAKWVQGWGNYFARPVKELTGRWAADYEKEFAVRINQGVDVYAPEQMLFAYQDKAEILLAGYCIMLAVCEIPDDPDTDENTAYQEMDMNEYIAPYTLLNSVFTAGEILGYDTSGWRAQANSRIGGAISVGFIVADVAAFIITKCNPVTGLVEGAFHVLDAGRHALTKGKKEQRLAAKIRSALEEDRDTILAAMQSCMAPRRMVP
jgi:hypothetical protein